MLDSVTIRRLSTFVFQLLFSDDYVIHRSAGKVRSEEIDQLFGHSAPNSVTAALTNPRSGRILLFQGCLFVSMSLASCFADPSVHTFSQRSILAKLNNWLCSDVRRNFNFQGRRVYAYEESIDVGYSLANGFPKDLPSSVPFSPDIAFLHTDGNQILVKVILGAFYES